MLRNATRQLHKRRSTLTLLHRGLPARGSPLLYDASQVQAPTQSSHAPRALSNRKHGASRTGSARFMTTLNHEAEAPCKDAPLHHDSVERPARDSRLSDVDVDPQNVGTFRNRRSSNPIRRKRGEQRQHTPRFDKEWPKYVETASPNSLLKGILSGERSRVQEHAETIAALRTRRLPVIVAQVMIRDGNVPLLPDPERALALLPDEQEWSTILRILEKNGQTEDDILTYTDILANTSDEARCAKFLEADQYLPLFLFNFMVRDSSTLSDVSQLRELIAYCRRWYTDVRRSSRDWEDSIPLLSNHAEPNGTTVDFLVRQCNRLELRLLPQVAKIPSRCIQVLSQGPAERRDNDYLLQCQIFNTSLVSLRPIPDGRPRLHAMANDYVWAAQEVLLNTSANLKRPLLTNLEAYRSIREVLASLRKSLTDQHSSARHAPTWPPYLKPADGMDEITETEDTWSRTVHAGAMMQEEGFAKEDQDVALDTLQGIGRYSSPTIQQRVHLHREGSISPWTASIMATRNAREAWDRFQHFHNVPTRPGPREYKAMFQKLLNPEVGVTSSILPGDKAVNFTGPQQSNLTEVERMRLQPPTVQRLYEHMLGDGIKPAASCLCLLAAHAPNLKTLRKYVDDSWLPDASRSNALKFLDFGHLSCNHMELRTIGSNLFMSLITALLRFRSYGLSEIEEIICVIDRRYGRAGATERRWASTAWHAVLNKLTESSTGMTPEEHLGAILHTLLTAKSRRSTHLPVVLRFAKACRAHVGRQLKFLLNDLSFQQVNASSSLRPLYDRPVHAEDLATKNRLAEARQEERNIDFEGKVHYLRGGYAVAAMRLKSLFDRMVEQERNRSLPPNPERSPLTHMEARTDPVLPGHVWQILSAFAHLGEFEEMARVLQWVLQEWIDADVDQSEFEDWESRNDCPTSTDVICLFRHFAEPMLKSEVVDAVKELVMSDRCPFQWPSDEVLETTRLTYISQSFHNLYSVLKLIRHQRDETQRKEQLQTREATTAMEQQKTTKAELAWATKVAGRTP